MMIKEPLAAAGADYFSSKDNSTNRLSHSADHPWLERSTCCIYAAEGAAWWASFALGWKDDGTDLEMNKTKNISVIMGPFVPHKASVQLIMRANCNEAETQKLSTNHYLGFKEVISSSH